MGEDQHFSPSLGPKRVLAYFFALEVFFIGVLADPRRALLIVRSCAFPTVIGLMGHWLNSIDLQSVISCVYISSGSPDGFRRNVMIAAKCMSAMAFEMPPHPHGFDPFRSHSVYSSNWLSSSGSRDLALSITALHSSPVGSASSQLLRVMTYCGFPDVLSPLPRSSTSIVLTALSMTFAQSSRLFFSIARWHIPGVAAAKGELFHFAGGAPASLAALSSVLHSLAMKLSTLPLTSQAWSCRLRLGFTSSHRGSRYNSRAQLSCFSFPSNGWVQFPVPGGPWAMYEW